MSKFQVYKDAAGKFRFRLRAGNNQIVAVGEAYEQHANCINGIRSIQKNCNSEIEDLTIIDRKVSNPKYQIYKDTAGKFRFRLKATNGEIIAEGEGYESKEGCLNGIKVVRSSCDAEIEDLSVPKETVQENVVPPKMEETASPTVEPEAKTEETPQPMQTPTVETKVPKTNYPTETKLELYTVTENINKGNNVNLKGKLSESDSGKGVSGAKIRIHERDTSILGDAYLAQGVTGEDGSFSIVWRAKPLTWRKNTGNIYAIFYGNETGKPSKSSIQPVIIN